MSHDTSNNLRPELQNAFGESLMAAARAKQAGANRTQQDQAGSRAARATIAKASMRQVALIVFVIALALVVIAAVVTQ